MSKWSYVALGEICEITGGNSAPQGNEPFDNGTLPFVRMRDLGRYHFTSNLNKTDDKLTENAVQKYRMKIFEPGCILFPRSGSVFLNHRAILGIRAAIVSHIGVLHKFSDSINVRFLYYYLQTYDMTRLSKKTTGVDSIAFSDVVKIQIPLPPLPEQEWIARLLDESESLQATRTHAKARMEQFIPGLFQQMFGDEKFPNIKLSDLCHFITKGTTPKSQDIKDEVIENDDVPFIKVYHITDDGGIDFHYHPAFVSRSIHNVFLKRSIVYPNDVLMNIVGPPLGKIGIVPSEYNEWNINQAIAIFRAKEKIEPLYLLHTLRHKPILNKLLSQAVGIRQYNLSLEQCRNFMIPVPPLALQREFAARVEAARGVQSAQARSAERIEALYQSMLSRAFAGEL